MEKARGRGSVTIARKPHHTDGVGDVESCYAEGSRWSRMRSLLKLLATLLLVVAGSAQAASEPAGKLNCGADKFGPFLDFEFRFVTGAWFNLPVKQFVGTRFTLDLNIIVEPVNDTPGDPIIMEDFMRSPDVVPLGTKGAVRFGGAFSTGLGQYRMRWRIIDNRGRKCLGSRQFKVALSRGERTIEVTLAPGEIEDATTYLLRPEFPADRPHLRSPQRLKIFVSLDVLGRRRLPVRPRMTDLLPHFSALRQLVRSQEFNEFSIVVFSFEDQSVVARQDYSPTVDFPGLGNIVDELEPETVDFEDLYYGSELQFFTSMLLQELAGSKTPTAAVFIGHETKFGKEISSRALNRLRQLGASFAFLDVSYFVWRGVMGNFVRAMNGREYKLRKPSDLAKAVTAFEGQVRATKLQ